MSRWEMASTEDITCPTCGSELDRADPISGEYRIGSDHAAVVTVPDRDDYEPENPAETRGGWTEVHYQCGSGHRSLLVVVNHKGMERVILFRERAK